MPRFYQPNFYTNGGSAVGARRTKRPTREELIELYSEFSIGELAEWFDVDRSSVNKWFRLYGIPRHRQEFLPFEEARGWVDANVKAKTKEEWVRWAKSDMRPNFIPADPVGRYRNDGWTNWSYWLGVAKRRGGWLPFEAAREWVQQNQVASSYSNWRRWAKTSARPEFIPAGPATVYAKQWQGWNDWLGTELSDPVSISKQFLPFEEARKWIQTNVPASSNTEWAVWLRTGQRPRFIPADPATAYRNQGWQNWGHWFGTGTKSPAEIHTGFLPFQEAREFVRRQGLLSHHGDWKRWSKVERPPFIPSNPVKVYQDEWISWTNWLEYPPTEESLVPLQMRRAIKRKMREKQPTIASMLSYAQAKKTIQSVAEQEGWESFTDVYEWLRREDRPEYFPRNPREFYEDWWKGWADFVGPELAPPTQTRDYLTLSGLAATHDQPFYHGSYDPLPVGTVMAGRGEEYEADWQNTDFYNILEHYRPNDKLPHKAAVFMVGDPDDIDLAGGATDYILTMEPLGSVTKHDLNWSSEISSLISEGYDPDSGEVELAATNYWEGVPHSDENVWEFLTPQARVTAVEAY